MVFFKYILYGLLKYALQILCNNFGRCKTYLQLHATASKYSLAFALPFCLFHYHIIILSHYQIIKAGIPITIIFIRYI